MDDFRQIFVKTMSKLPIYSNGYLRMYAPMVNSKAEPVGYNHDTKTQIYQNALYYYMLSLLDSVTIEDNNNLRLYFQRNHGLASGFTLTGRTNLIPADEMCNPEYLAAISLATMVSKSDGVIGEFEEAVFGIVKNNYNLKDNDNRLYGKYGWGKNTIHLMAALSLIKTSTYIKERTKLLYKRFGIVSKLRFKSTNDFISAFILSQKTTGLEKKYWTALLNYNWKWNKKYKANGFILSLIEKTRGERMTENDRREVYHSLVDRTKSPLGLALELVALEPSKCKYYMKGISEDENAKRHSN